MFNDDFIKEFNEKARVQTIKEACDQLFKTLAEHNEYPIKRAKLYGEFTTAALIYVETSFVGGGNCYDESNHYDSHVSNEKLNKAKIFEYQQLFNLPDVLEALLIDKEQLHEWITHKVNQESRHAWIDEFTQREYYGNSTTYSIYKIDVSEVISHFCTEEIQNIYQQQLIQYQSLSKKSCKM